MKTIRLSDKELEFLRTQYQVELVEAEKYIQAVKNLLMKLGVTPITKEPITEKKSRRGRPKKAEVVAPKEKKKRGRKPKVEVQSIITEKSKPEDAKKADKPKKVKSKRGRKPKKSTEVEKKVLPEPVHKVVPKKKPTRKSHRRKGLVLTSLRKPLRKKELPIIEPELSSPTVEAEQIP